MIRIAAAGLLGSILAHQALAATASFTPLGIITGFDGSNARDVSDDGATVVGWLTYQHGQFGGFQWTAATGMVSTLASPGRSIVSTYGTSSDGSVLVGFDSTSAAPFAYQAFRWTSATGSVDLGEISAGGGSAAFSVSADGNSISGQAGNAEGNGEAFRWTSDDGMVGLGTLPGTAESAGYGISADGSTVVGVGFTGGDEQAFRWTQAQGMVALPNLPGASSSVALTANSDGMVVAGYDNVTWLSKVEPQAVRWTAQTGTESLGTLPGRVGSQAGGMSADGSMIVGECGGQAFLWTTFGGMMDLRSILSANGATGFTEWPHLTANNISADGRFIVGVGLDPSGHQQAWLATLPVFAAGDINLDGIVNAQDIALASSNWLSTGIGMAGDANGDGIVNSQDLALMSSNWMAKAIGGTRAVAVPEPRALRLAVLCALLFIVPICRHR